LRPALRRKPRNLIIFYSVPKKIPKKSIAQNANQSTTKRHINLVFLLSLYAFSIYIFLLFIFSNKLTVCVCVEPQGLQRFLSFYFLLSFVFVYGLAFEVRTSNARPYKFIIHNMILFVHIFLWNFCEYLALY